MDDHDLIKAAALGAGYEWPPQWPFPTKGGVPFDWNPIVSDADAFKLAVQLRLSLIQHPDGMDVTIVFPPQYKLAPIMEQQTLDRYEGMRRAIVRAAAEIAKSKNLI